MDSRQDGTESAGSWLPNFLRKSTDTKFQEPDERTSLLPKPDDEPTIGSVDDFDDEDKSSTQLIIHEFWVLLSGSTPVFLAYMLQNSLQTVSVLVVGRLSPEALAAAAFSYMFAMASGWLIALGGTTAIDTLASASFTGSKDKHDLGIILQRALFVLGLLYIPVAILWFCSEPVFRALGQDEQLSHDSSKFLSVLALGGLGYIYFECLKKFLQAQGIMRPGTYVLLITSSINAGLNYLFVYTCKMGLLGAPLATSISYWLSFLLLLAYARFVSGWDCWGGWSKKAFQNIGTFTRLALLGVVHVGTEWWAFEIVALAAGKLGTIPLAAQSVIMTTDQVLNTIPFGVGVATSARVGNLLGGRNAKGAARSANVAAWLSMILGALVLALLMGVKNFYARIFNDDQDVIKLTAEVMPWVALFQIADGLNGSCGGSLRGMGRQHVGALVNIISYYCGALPLGIWLAFHGWGLAGLWVGQCIALYLVGFGEWAIVAWSNWDYQVRKAFERMEHEEQVESGLANNVEGYQGEESR
ncbi:mate family transporter [Aureobasidium pullulans]|uniref:Mate family transporter n=1 Tax=Aureobasidium pullulans TaxID=5580 RepID=A0A4S9VCJ1_AURPU|nr:mate family transporter [Aureobasidium pullulans]